MTNEFNVGDTVKLKAGGPDMSVSKVWSPGSSSSVTIRGQWFAGKKLESGDFPPESLEAVRTAAK